MDDGTSKRPPRTPVSEHRHQTPLRGTKVVPRPPADQAGYSDVNYRYAGREGRIHEVMTVGGKQFAKVGFDDRKIVYYFIDDLEFDENAARRTFHDEG